MFELTTEATWYSWFKTAEFILPPKLDAPDIVTKSPAAAPWLESVTVTMLEPLVAAKLKVLVLVFLIGVTSCIALPLFT